MTRAPEPLEDPISQAYVEWCTAERVPANTIRRRRAALRSLKHAGVATREDVEDWWAARRHLKPSTRANDLAVVRSFYKWCQIWEHRTDDPTVRLVPPKPETGAPRPINRAELEAILARVERKPELRRAVLLAAWAGLRREEAARLTWDDIDPDTRQARVLGKGRKIRYVALSTRLIDALLPDTGGNVVTGRVRGWSAHTLGKKVNTEIRAAGVDATFHKLRHRYGSLGYQRSKDPKALAEQMGHASVATTMQFYAAAADGAGRAIADAVSED